MSSNNTGNASGVPQIDMEMPGVEGKAQINDGAAFNQTVTGKAIEDACKKIGQELNKFFEGKI